MCSVLTEVRARVEYSALTFVVADTEYSLSTDKLELTIADGKLIAVNASETREFAVEDLQKMYFSDATTTADVAGDTTVVVTYSGNTASVTIADNIKSYVSATISGADVNIIQASTVDATTSGEITYILTGTSTDGSFYMEGSYKATIELQGLTLTNPDGPALNIQNGKRVKISSKSGTTNTLTDGENGDWKGAFVCKGHSEFQGKGTLNVYGHTAHGIWSKEYIEQKNCTINVLSAVKDGVHCGQYFSMASGELNIKGFGSDGIDVGIKDSTLVNDDTDTGSFFQTGGDITIWMAGAAGEGVEYVGQMSRTGGTLTIIDATSVESVSLQEELPVDIYTLLGLSVGRYASPQEARNILPKGVYVVRQKTATGKLIIP